MRVSTFCLYLQHFLSFFLFSIYSLHILLFFLFPFCLILFLSIKFFCQLFFCIYLHKYSKLRFCGLWQATSTREKPYEMIIFDEEQILIFARTLPVMMLVFNIFLLDHFAQKINKKRERETKRKSLFRKSLWCDRINKLCVHAWISIFHQVSYIKI